MHRGPIRIHPNPPNALTSSAESPAFAGLTPRFHPNLSPSPRPGGNLPSAGSHGQSSRRRTMVQHAGGRWRPPPGSLGRLSVPDGVPEPTAWESETPRPEACCVSLTKTSRRTRLGALSTTPRNRRHRRWILPLAPTAVVRTNPLGIGRTEQREDALAQRTPVYSAAGSPRLTKPSGSLAASRARSSASVASRWRFHICA